jgi:hypothetical protein
MVVMSIEQYERIQYDNEILIKLKEAELEAKTSKVRYSHTEVFDQLKGQFKDSE